MSALDLYVRFKGNPPSKSSAEIMGLSAIPNRLSGIAEEGRSDFRNPNGVYMKLMNFRRFDPIFQAQGKSGLVRGNKLEEVVWKDFASDPHRLARTVEAIKTNLEVAAERSKKIVEAKKAACLKETGTLRCEACGFEFDLVCLCQSRLLPRHDDGRLWHRNSSPCTDSASREIDGPTKNHHKWLRSG